MLFVSRKQWGARAPRSVSRTINPAKGGVTFHWEGPHMGAFGHDKCAGKVRGIQRYHMESRGYADIAYTALVCPHGHVYEGRGIGVRTAANGTDAGNDSWYAVCSLAGEGDPFTDAEKRGLRDAASWLRSSGGASGRVSAHRDHKATACPGDERYRWVHAGMPIAGPVAAPTAPKPVPAPPTHPPGPTGQKETRRKVYVLLRGKYPTNHPDYGKVYVADAHSRRHVSGGWDECRELAAEGFIPKADVNGVYAVRDVSPALLERRKLVV